MCPLSVTVNSVANATLAVTSVTSSTSSIANAWLLLCTQPRGTNPPVWQFTIHNLELMPCEPRPGAGTGRGCRPQLPTVLEFSLHRLPSLVRNPGDAERRLLHTQSRAAVALRLRGKSAGQAVPEGLMSGVRRNAFSAHKASSGFILSSETQPHVPSLALTAELGSSQVSAEKDVCCSVQAVAEWPSQPFA